MIKDRIMTSNMNMNRFCDRVMIVYWCMHVNKYLYSVCGAHKDKASINLNCYNKCLTQYREEEPNLVMG